MVSRHRLAVYQAFTAQPQRWLSNRQVAEQADVAPRTARAHTREFVRAGLLEWTATFPGHRYRLASTSKAVEALVSELRAAAVVFEEEEP